MCLRLIHTRPSGGALYLQEGRGGGQEGVRRGGIAGQWRQQAPLAPPYSPPKPGRLGPWHSGIRISPRCFQQNRRPRTAPRCNGTPPSLAQVHQSHGKSRLAMNSAVTPIGIAQRETVVPHPSPDISFVRWCISAISANFETSGFGPTLW